MKTNIEVSDYLRGRYNSIKLDKLVDELKVLFSRLESKDINFPNGLEVYITMSAKYQYLYIKVSNWGDFLRVGLFEEAVQEALENRGFVVGELDGEDDYFTMSFD
jgi:hypothetical protein